MNLELTLASEAEAEAIAALRNEVTEHLTATFGHGHWSSAASAKACSRTWVGRGSLSLDAEKH